ncbi:hypothetical protein IIA79_06680, partial [bacterium]|nr:hypothetical protein [bacterium]
HSVVLAGIDYQQVSRELAETLKACVAGGTSIVFSLGFNGAGVSQSPLATLCPLNVGGTVQLSELGSFGRAYGIQASGSPATFAIGQVAPGAEVLSWAGSYPAVIRSFHGSGTATALAFDFTAVPFKQNPQLAPVFADNVLRVTDSVAVTNWFIHPDPVSKVLKELSEAKPMSPGFVALFLLIYIVLIGPLNFLILGRLKRRTLVWITIPAIIAIFSYTGMYTGYFYRGSDNVTAYFQELHIFPGAAYTPYQTVMLIFTAERTHYELEVPDRSAFLYPDIPELRDNYMYYAANRSRKFSALKGAKIDNSDLPIVSATQGKWTTKEYFYQGYLNLGAQVTADISAVHNKNKLVDVEGSFTIDLPFDLYDCYIYAPYYKLDYGNLAGKGTYSLSAPTASNIGSMPEDNYLVQSMARFSEEQQNGSNAGLAYRNELLLVGFTDEVAALAEFQRPHVEHVLSMVVVHLPYKPVIPTSGSPEVTRMRLEGGAGFTLEDPFSYGGYGGRHSHHGQQAQTRQYRIEDGGYLDLSYEIAGHLGRNSLLHLSLVGYEGSDHNQVTDYQPYLEIAAWDGDRWRESRITPDYPAVGVPLEGLLDENRRITVRIRARKALMLQVPQGHVY